MTKEYSFQQRLMAYFFMILLPAVLAYFSVRLAKDALAFTDQLLWLRIPLFTLSGILMLCTIWLVVSPLRRKFKTGHFLLSSAERMAKMAEYRSKMGAGKPLGPQAKYWILPLSFIALFLGLGLTILVVILRNTCGCRDLFSQQLMIVPLLLAAAILALPAWFFFKTIQRKLKTGSFLPSQEELAKARASCAKPKPLWQRILFSALFLGVAVLYTAGPIIRLIRHRPPMDSLWVIAALWWVIAAIWIRQLFRASASQCAFSIESEEPHNPPEEPAG
ncbi:MAG: hypothetical protein ABSC77_11075 [Terracidiphilus sp.]